MKKIRVIGLNLNRLLDRIQSLEVFPQKIERVAYNEIIFEILNKDYKILVANKVFSCYNISVLSSTPSHPLIMEIIKRLGLVVGLIIPIIILTGVISKIWKVNIEVVGEANRDINSVVTETLDACGVGVGQTFNWTTRDLERELVSKIDECASAVVTKRGVNLDIKLELLVCKPVQSNTDIVASHAGRITDVKLKSGILLVNIGEGVSAGQTLISSGTVGDYYAEAKGEITADVIISGEAVGATKLEKMERTGAFVDVKAYSIFGKDWFWNNTLDDAKSNYEGSEVERTEVRFSPLKLVKFRVYELRSVPVLLDEEALVEDLKTSAYNMAKTNLPVDSQERAVTYDVFKDGDIIKVVCNIETEMIISVSAEK